MNPRTALSSDGRLRRAFTVRDVERMVEVGIIDPDERLEIVGGEIFLRPQKGRLHENLRIPLTEALYDGVTPDQHILPAAGWRLGEQLYLEPDLLVFPASVDFPAVRGQDALLVVEIADSTLGTDLGLKAALYAEEGVRDYWVVDAVSREIHVHRDPGQKGYRSVQVVAPTGTVTAALTPFSVRMADLFEY